MTISIDSIIKHSYSNDDTCFTIDVINEIMEEDLNALLDEGSKILYSVKVTPLEQELFAEFDKFMAMNIKETDESLDDEDEEMIFEEIRLDIDFNIKKYIEETPIDLELKPLLDHLEYAFLEGTSLLSVIISSKLSK
ncbi:hypothetical protein Tco_1066739 [Tanacetum coccineum]|uniref:Reverse transcriptase domain-containing protein n=1 Tax=Tanacetum coccineum TaxID=301880 RepID=A0ABQ5HAY2_9ASTR